MRGKRERGSRKRGLFSRREAAPEEAKLLDDDAGVTRDLIEVLARWNGAPPGPDLAGSTASMLAAPPDMPVGHLEAHSDVQSVFNQHDGALSALRAHDETTPHRVPPDRSPDARTEELHRLLDALEAHAPDIDSSLDPKPVAKRQAPPPRVVRAEDPQLGVRVYLGAVWRFRWLIPIAVCAAIAVPLLMLYRPIWPPGLEARSTVSYVTTTQLLVDSPSGPFLRTETMSSGPSVAPVKPGSETPAQSGSSQPFDKKSLVDAANLFPLLMESDDVLALRQKLIGNVPGTVRATALFATQGANRFRPSVLPLMQIIAVAPTPKGAFSLGQGTARAFTIWLAQEQNRATVPTGERIIVRQLRQPSIAEQTGGPGYGMPILAGLAVLGAFVGLAVALDRALPRVRPPRQPSLSSVETVPSTNGGSELEPVEPVEPQASTHMSPYSDSLSRISEIMREARAGSRPG